MWNDYFYQIQKKYSMRLSTKEPLVIRLDGKNVTKNKEIDLINQYKGSFLEALEKTVKHFTAKYHCMAIFGSDEISFVFTNPMILMEDIDTDKDNHSNEVISVFSQYIFDYFNQFDKHKKVFWHAKCFSIPKDKINSYIKYRSASIKNVMITYFLKTKNVKMGNEKLAEKIKKCETYPDYMKLSKICNGILYLDGSKINMAEFLNGNIVKIDDEIIENKFLDLFDF